ncbi:MAG: amidohydrolase [Acidobacteria bacterium]|nr:MAG: amidohydrolase [Acidobacteriota bacterium]
MSLRILMVAVFISTAPAYAQEAGVILYNGKIVTADQQFRVVDSIAIRGERIVGIGAREEVARLAGPSTRKIDLRGKTVLPGLIDSHVHAADAAMYEFDHPVPEMETIADVLWYIKSRAAVAKEGEWIALTQVFVTRLRDQRFPTRAELDAAAPRNPVYFGTGPDASVNSLALKLSGIDKNFEIADGKPGRIERDPNGEPTGILRSCSRLIKIHSGDKTPTDEDRLRRLKMLLTDYNSVGITSLSERDLGDQGIELYRRLREKGELTCRVYVMYSVDAQMPLDQVKQRILSAARGPLHRYDNMLWVRGIKTYLDGGMLTGSAYMLEPWGLSQVYSIDDPNYRGMRYIEPDKLYKIARFALQNELQFTAHSVGDGAVQAMVDAYSEVNKEFPVRPARPCITHANFMTAAAIQKMKALGIVLDLQPAWLWLDGATLRKQFGNQRLAYFQPYKSLFDNGVIVGGGSDHMQKIGSLRSINPYNPFLGMWITLTRQPRWTDQPLHPEQRISREQAIRLYTLNNAYLTFEEKEKGSLEKDARWTRLEASRSSRRTWAGSWYTRAADHTQFVGSGSHYQFVRFLAGCRALRVQ